MRRVLTIAVCVLTAPAFAKVKILDMKFLPGTASGLTAMLEKEKAAGSRIAASQALDELIRKKPVELNAADADQAVTAVLDGVFEHMAAATDIYTWDKATFGPRGDVLCREEAKVTPGRVSGAYEHRFTKTLKGKRIDRGYLNSPCTLAVSSAGSLADFHLWTRKGWGIELGAVLATDVDAKAGSQVARVGLTLVSPGTSEAAPVLERPSYVGFAVRPRPGEPFALLSVEPPASLDWRKQPCNLCATEGKPSDAERHLKVVTALEQLALANLAASQPSAADQQNFLLEADPLGPKDKAWLEPYQTSDSPMVRAAVALKLSKLGGNVPAANLADLTASLPHPWFKTCVVQELVRTLGTALDQGAAPPEADQQAMWNTAVEKARQASDTVYEAKVAQGFARLKVNNRPGFLFRQTSGGWVLVGALP